MTDIQEEDFLVSIIINNYNYAEFLEDAINSALNQSYPNTEIILVDDGSDDESHSIIEKYRTELICIEKGNGGQASAINCGYFVCSGQLILFLDADDIIHKSTVQSYVDAWLNKDEDVSRIQAPLKIQCEDLSIHGKLFPMQPLIDGSLRQVVLKYGPASYPCPPMSGNIWSRDFLSKVLPMPADVYKTSADAYLFTLAPLFGNFISLQEPAGIYRIHHRNSYWRQNISIKQLRSAGYQHKQRCLILETFAKSQGEDVDEKKWRLSHRYYLAKIAILCKLKGRRCPISFATFKCAVLSANISLYKKTFWLIWFLCVLATPQRLIPVLLKPYLNLQFRV